MRIKRITLVGVALTALASCSDETSPVINRDGGDLPALEVCDDKKDNDQDGKTDCADPDCAYAPQCGGSGLDLGPDQAAPKEDAAKKDQRPAENDLRPDHRLEPDLPRKRDSRPPDSTPLDAVGSAEVMPGDVA